MEKTLKEILKVLKSIDGRLKNTERHFKNLSRETPRQGICQGIPDEQEGDDS